jgi:8-amino-7-oxononanoate synthase
MQIPKKLAEKIETRAQNNALRKLTLPTNSIDFSSNDYIRFSKNKAVFEQTHQYLIDNKIIQN